jgi:radical SAM superfamily enzyme YgiQ (UPF0313 family)
MKRALLVNPWVYDFKCHDFWIKPFGLLRLSSFLKENGFEVDLIDCMDRLDPDAPAEFRVSDEMGRGAFYSEEIAKPAVYNRVPRKYKRYGLPVEAFKRKLETLVRPDIIFTGSSMTYNYEGVILANSLLKEKFSRPVVLGGIYPTLCREHAQKYSGADHIWTGEINNSFIMLVNRLCPARLDLKQDKDFNELAPDYTLYKEIGSVAVKFTRGCPFSCSYCAIKSFSADFYQRQPEKIFKELDYYKGRSVKNIAFYDDALIYKNFFIKGILREIIKRGYGFNFHTPNGLHAAYIDDELAKLMKDAGFRELRISLESTDYNIQKQTGSKVNNNVFKEAVDRLRKAGFNDNDIGVYTLAGLPGQTYDMVMKDVEYIGNMGLRIKIANYSPIPGTVDFMKIKPDYKAELTREPLMQNEFYFLMINPEYDWEANNKVKQAISGIDC